jgi:hypothetical protein
MGIRDNPISAFGSEVFARENNKVLLLLVLPKLNLNLGKDAPCGISAPDK